MRMHQINITSYDDRCILYDARGLYDKFLRLSVFSTGSQPSAFIEDRTRILS